jgi:hypothetical protein
MKRDILMPLLVIIIVIFSVNAYANDIGEDFIGGIGIINDSMETIPTAEGDAYIQEDGNIVLPDNGLTLLSIVNPASATVDSLHIIASKTMPLTRGTYFGINLLQWSAHSIAVNDATGDVYMIVYQIGDTKGNEWAKYRGLNAPEDAYYKSFVSAWDPFGRGDGWVYVGHLRYYRIGNTSSILSGFFTSEATCPYTHNTRSINQQVYVN